MQETSKISNTDFQILEILEKNSKTPLKEISRQLSIPPSTAFERIKKMEEAGIITQYSVKTDLELLGYTSKALILIKFDPYSKASQKEALKELCGLPEVIEGHVISGTHDIALKCVSKNTKALGILITEKIRKVNGVLETLTLTVFHSEKE